MHEPSSNKASENQGKAKLFVPKADDKVPQVERYDAPSYEKPASVNSVIESSLIENGANYSLRTRLVYIILGVVFGPIGAHNFYAHRNKFAIIQLLITLLALMFSLDSIIWLVSLWVLVELFSVQHDAHDRPMI